MGYGIERYSQPPWDAGQEAYGQALDDNEVLLDWVLDDGADHCEECPDVADGGPYTADELDVWPGDLECQDNCRCSIQAEESSWNAFIGS